MRNSSDQLLNHWSDIHQIHRSLAQGQDLRGLEVLGVLSYTCPLRTRAEESPSLCSTGAPCLAQVLLRITAEQLDK